MKNRYSLLLLSLILILVGTDLSGQKQKPKNESWYDDKLIHFGFSLGMNLMDFNITPAPDAGSPNALYPEVSRLNPGINIQIVTNLNLARYFDVRFLPGVGFGQRVIRYYKNQVIYDETQRLESSFLEFPLLLKYKGERMNNVRPYVIGGMNFRYDLAGKKEFDENKQVYLRLKRPDLYYEAGAGFDFYLTYFKLSVELKLSKGIGDVLVKEPHPQHPEFYNAIEKMKSQIWIIAFHFE